MCGKRTKIKSFFYINLKFPTLHRLNITNPLSCPNPEVTYQLILVQKTWTCKRKEMVMLTCHETRLLRFSTMTRYSVFRGGPYLDKGLWVIFWLKLVHNLLLRIRHSRVAITATAAPRLVTWISTIRESTATTISTESSTSSTTTATGWSTSVFDMNTFIQ